MEILNDIVNPSVSFCISTYKRPELLHSQLDRLLKQTYPNLEIIISDNDPLKSAEKIANSFADNRIKYYPNAENLGMIKSFNKSIDRSDSEHIIMITDDDPLDIHFLEEMVPIINKYPSYSIYAAANRSNKSLGLVEIVKKDDFAYQFIHPGFTLKALWSNAIIRKNTALLVGKIPDYDSPHLADHAFLALCGSVDGGVIINKNFGDHVSHAQAYSMGNISSYYSGCKGFYETLANRYAKWPNKAKILTAVQLHLYKWFIVRSFFLRKTYHRSDKSKIKEINIVDKKILQLSFMSGIVVKYKF